MKKFILEIFVFIMILGSIIFLVKNSVPYYWGNDLIGQKIQYLYSQPKKYNTFFIGSSGIYRHIDPIIFDSITHSNSYNLGASGMFTSETNYILSHFIKDYMNDDKHFQVLMRYKKLSRIREHELHTVRKKYFVNFYIFKKAVLYFFKNGMYDQVYNYSIHFIENSLGIGEFFDIYKYHFSVKESIPLEVLEKNRGFYSLDDEFEETNNVQLERRKNKLERLLRRGKFKPKHTESFEIKIMSDSEISANLVRNNISYFYLDGNNFQDPKYFFDKGHLNAEGAKLYTQFLANAYMELMDSNEK